MNGRPSLKLGMFFSLLVFVIMTLSMTLIAAIGYLAFHFGIIKLADRDPYFPIILFSLISIIIGTTLSILAGKKILTPIIEMSEATIEVAKGNFNVRLEENNRVREINLTARNFNTMVQELDKIETFRSDFIANVSHEFKTPLAAIEGYVTLLQDKNATAEEIDEYIKIIMSNAKRLSTLSDNILSISKLENQEIIIEKAAYMLDEQIRQVLLLFESKWSGKGIDLDLDLDPVSYYGNEELLLQVWVNLLGNAIKFTPDQGKITVSLKESGHRITVSITDTGIGIDESAKKHIFEKFYQGDTSHSIEGNGLGLTLVKRIIDLCGGDIMVESEVGSGSTFVVTLPR